MIYDSLDEANKNREIEWSGGKTDLSYAGNELAGEVGEVCNVIKKLERERLGMVGSRATREQLEEELGDAATCLRLVALRVGIDLEHAERVKFNKVSQKYGLTTLVRE